MERNNAGRGMHWEGGRRGRKEAQRWGRVVCAETVGPAGMRPAGLMGLGGTHVLF